MSNTQIKDAIAKVSISNLDNEVKLPITNSFKSENTTEMVAIFKAINNEGNNDSTEVTLFIPNANTADFSLDPIYAIASDLPDSNVDIIHGWYYENDEKIDVVISEKFALSAEKPVFIVNKSENNIFDNKVSSTKKGQIKSTAVDIYYRTPIIKKYSITERYDNSKKSEYKYKLAFELENGTFAIMNSHKIADIHKNDLYDFFYTTHYIGDVDAYIRGNTAGNIVEKVYMATYEHDWYATKKAVAFSGEGIVPSFLKMSNLDEYYQQLVFLPDEPGPISSPAKGVLKLDFSELYLTKR